MAYTLKFLLKERGLQKLPTFFSKKLNLIIILIIKQLTF